MIKTDRREFLRLAAAGMAALTTGQCKSPSGTENNTPPTTDFVFENRAAVNPLIENARVAACTDTALLLSGADSPGDFKHQNSLIDTARVSADLDAMAINLTGAATAANAWKMIFQKPASKEWSSVTAAVKVNTLYDLLMPHAPVVSAVCQALISVGVLPANITIYDSGNTISRVENHYGPLVGTIIPSGVVVSSAKADGPLVPTILKPLQCTSVLAKKNSNGTIAYCKDIIVNCSVNKGHSIQDVGGFTLAMKNHIGSMKFQCPTMDELVAINKSEAITGYRNGIPWRQQLCIVDSLWAANAGPSSPISKIPRTLVMGTFAPVVDYLTAKKVREGVMLVTNHNQQALSRMLSDFGYDAAELSWITVNPA